MNRHKTYESYREEFPLGDGGDELMKWSDGCPIGDSWSFDAEGNFVGGNTGPTLYAVLLRSGEFSPATHANGQWRIRGKEIGDVVLWVRPFASWKATGFCGLATGWAWSHDCPNGIYLVEFRNELIGVCEKQDGNWPKTKYLIDFCSPLPDLPRGFSADKTKEFDESKTTGILTEMCSPGFVFGKGFAKFDSSTGKCVSLEGRGIQP